MTDQAENARRFRCCKHCAEHPDDHEEFGGSVSKDGHEVECSTCEFDARIAPRLAQAKREALREAAIALGSGPTMRVLVERESCDWWVDKSIAQWLRERADAQSVPPAPLTSKEGDR